MRHEDWPTRLWGALDNAADTPFLYGVHDCVLLTAACLDAMCVGTHWRAFAAELYHDKRSALRLVMRAGGLGALITQHLATPGVPRNLARRGDVVEVESDDGPAVGVSVGERIAVAAIPFGYVLLPADRARCAWQVD